MKIFGRSIGIRRFCDYLLYYRRKSCIFSLSTLSIFDARAGNRAKQMEIFSIAIRRSFPAFPGFRQNPLVSAEIYIKFFIKVFYEELSTLSTRFSTSPFSLKPAGSLPVFKL